MFDYIKHKINLQNFTFFFKFADVFHMPKLYQTTLHHIERCFTLAVESSNFLNLNFALVRKILCSSELHLTTEIEVFKAANDWIAYEREERTKFAPALLSTVRLHLLSDDALRSLMREEHHVCETDEIRAAVQSALEVKKMLSKENCCNFTASRYCSQEKFDIMFCEYDVPTFDNAKLTLVDGTKFEVVKKVSLKHNKESLLSAVCLKGEIYTIVNSKIFTNVNTIRKYSISSNVWKDLVDLDFRIRFCTCVLNDKIFIIGGRHNKRTIFDTCTQYDTKKLKIKKASGVNEGRYDAACATFGGKIVISGGLVYDDEHPVWGVQTNTTNTVEIYDHIADACPAWLTE